MVRGNAYESKSVLSSDTSSRVRHSSRRPKCRTRGSRCARVVRVFVVGFVVEVGDLTESTEDATVGRHGCGWGWRLLRWLRLLSSTSGTSKENVGIEETVVERLRLLSGVTTRARFHTTRGALELRNTVKFVPPKGSKVNPFEHRRSPGRLRRHTYRIRCVIEHTGAYEQMVTSLSVQRGRREFGGFDEVRRLDLRGLTTSCSQTSRSPRRSDDAK